jgi:outer membrane protein, multidrug efflux system
VRPSLWKLALGSLCAAVFGTLAVGHADPPPSRARLTLAECEARAERAYPGIAAQRHKIAASSAQLDEAWAAPFLNFSATGAVGIAPNARGNPTFSPDAFAQNPFDTGLGPLARISIDTGVPISPWTWWRIGRVRDAARAGIRANEHEMVKVRLELRTNVRRAFFALQLARDSKYLLDRTLGYLDTAEQQLSELRSTDGGAPSPNDRRQLRMSRFEAQARRAEAEQGERQAAFALGMLTGEGDQLDIVDEPLCPYRTTVHPLTQYLTEARLHRPEVQMIEAGLAARRAAVSIQWGQYLPDFALGVNVSWSDVPSITQQVNPFAGGNQNYAYWGALVVMRWNFEPLANTFRVRRLREELAMTEAQQRLALGGIGVEVAEVHARAVASSEREHLWGEAEREGFEWFSSVFQEYQAGTGEVSAIISPLRQYLQARASHLQAVYDFNVALAQLTQATGRGEMPGAPDPACVRPPVADTLDDGDAGISEEELERIMNASLDDAGAAIEAEDASRDAGSEVRVDASRRGAVRPR